MLIYHGYGRRSHDRVIDGLFFAVAVGAFSSYGVVVISRVKTLE
jgi:hypothetical protein